MTSDSERLGTKWFDTEIYHGCLAFSIVLPALWRVRASPPQRLPIVVTTRTVLPDLAGTPRRQNTECSSVMTMFEKQVSSELSSKRHPSDRIEQVAPHPA